jgi:RNA polymerase sigma-70 factor (ECF subfamily)
MDTRMDIRTRAQSADWEAVYAQWLPRVYNFFRYRVGDDALAEDLTATTFMRAWRHRERYSGDLGAFSTWLFNIAHNLAVDHFRRKRDDLALDQVSLTAADPPLEEAIQRGDDFARLIVLLGALTPRERELISLKYGAELTNRAIAGLTGMSESNVGTTLHRIILKLRHQWDDTR